MKKNLSLCLLALPVSITSTPAQKMLKKMVAQQPVAQKQAEHAPFAIQGIEGLTEALAEARKRQVPLFIKVYLPACAACIAVEPAFKAVAEKHGGKVLFATLSSADKKNSKLIGQLKIGMLPAFIGVSKKEAAQEHTSADAITELLTKKSMRFAGVVSEGELNKKVQDLIAGKAAKTKRTKRQR